MAKLINNVVMQGVSGTIGKMIVFRQMANGKTILAQRPIRKAPATPRELANREKITEAAHIAKMRTKDSVLKAQYLQRAKEGQSAYHVALTEYLNENKVVVVKPQPLSQEASIEIANLSLLAVNRLVMDKQITDFVQKTLNSGKTIHRPHIPILKRQKEIQICHTTSRKQPIKKDTGKSEKIPRSCHC